jgi:UDP-N-acetyl-2-amino-2-deoxyglucuronate dehydrogenase
LTPASARIVPWWRTDDYYRNSWHGTWTLDGGGALMNQTIHMIDTLCELLPGIESVQGLTSSIGHADIEAEDSAVACLKFAGGALGVIHGSTACYPGHPKRLEIMGTEGTVVYLEDSYAVFDFKDKKETDQQVLEQYGKMNYKSGFSDPKAISHALHVACFKDFMDCIENDKPFKIDGPEARKSVHLIESIYTSSKEKRIVKL